MNALINNEVITIESANSVAATVNRLEKILAEKGFTIFFRLDQQAVAKKVGLSMRRMEVLFFGKPEVGTQLMRFYPSIAMELPLKLVVEEQAEASLIRFISPQFLAKRHGIEKNIFNGLLELIKSAVDYKNKP